MTSVVNQNRHAPKNRPRVSPQEKLRIYKKQIREMQWVIEAQRRLMTSLVDSNMRTEESQAAEIERLEERLESAITKHHKDLIWILLIGVLIGVCGMVVYFL